MILRTSTVVGVELGASATAIMVLGVSTIVTVLLAVPTFEELVLGASIAVEVEYPKIVKKKYYVHQQL